MIDDNDNDNDNDNKIDLEHGLSLSTATISSLDGLLAADPSDLSKVTYLGLDRTAAAAAVQPLQQLRQKTGRREMRGLTVPESGRRVFFRPRRDEDGTVLPTAKSLPIKRAEEKRPRGMSARQWRRARKAATSTSSSGTGSSQTEEQS